MKGKTTKKKPDPVIEEVVPIPKRIRERHQDVSLSIDLMFVQNLAMLVMVSKYIKYTTIKTLQSHSVQEVEWELHHVCSLYCHHGFCMKTIHADLEFNPMRPVLLDMGIGYNEVAATEHIPEVE